LAFTKDNFPGEDIKAYVSKAASENVIHQYIIFEHKVISAKWHTEIQNLITGERCHYISSFFYSCVCYYNYDKGYTPYFKGVDSFSGDIIHPQLWPQNQDYAGRNVLIIGSGATGVTLVPDMAKHSRLIFLMIELKSG
jgi:monooxygenase